MGEASRLASPMGRSLAKNGEISGRRRDNHHERWPQRQIGMSDAHRRQRSVQPQRQKEAPPDPARLGLRGMPFAFFFGNTAALIGVALSASDGCAL